MGEATLCILGCGKAILKNLVTAGPEQKARSPFKRYIACVRSEKSERSLHHQFSEFLGVADISRGGNVDAVKKSQFIILGPDPADVTSVLTQPGLADALSGKLLISIVAGWTTQKIEETLYGDETTAADTKPRAWVVKVLPNIAAQVSQSITIVETTEPPLPPRYLEATNFLCEQIGRTVHVPPRLMSAAMTLGGSTPAFFSIICDAMIDASVAVGVPRDMAKPIIFQSMQGTASLLQSGMHTGILRDQGTAPEGCTIAGVMVLEENAVRRHVGRALREAVTVARLMETAEHVNDTRQGR
ncbi:hypothetical protein ACJ41O_014766 [Fusarium nematophilum]